MRQKFLLLTAIAALSLHAQDHRWAFNFGGGPTFSLSDTSDRIDTGYNFTLGGGYFFTKHLGVNVDYIFNGGDLSSTILKAAGAPGGYVHNWGFGFNPTYRFGTERKLGGYVTGGYGVYTRTANLTRPGVVPGIICDPWIGYCYSGAYYADIIYRSNSTTKGGWDFGGGITYQLSESMKFYTEIRYYNILTTTIRTQLLPLTFGLRW